MQHTQMTRNCFIIILLSLSLSFIYFLIFKSIIWFHLIIFINALAEWLIQIKKHNFIKAGI